MNSKKLVCEIGCGTKKVLENSIGVDIRKTEVVDIVADANYLPFKDGCFDIVYSSHTIEHFSHITVKDVLSEWIRILKTGGELELRCPDLRARSFLFFLNPSWENIKNIYGGQDYTGNYHKCGFTYKLLRDIVKDLGIDKIRRVIDGYKGIPFIPSDLHIKGIKSRQLEQ